MHYTLLMEPIAYIQTDFAQKFGIPRQSGLVPQLEGRIVFAPAYAAPDAVRGLDAFSHIWLLWEFKRDDQRDDQHSNQQSIPRDTPHVWSPLVRPPRLGGDKKMGVFATRSPNRPNRIALSCVRLLRVELERAADVYGSNARSTNARSFYACEPHVCEPNVYNSASYSSEATSTIANSAPSLAPDSLVPVLYVGGADLRNNTPIYDIKPYLPEFDAHPEATGGFTDEQPWRRLAVDIAPELLARIPEDKREALLGVLAEDPRPARTHTHVDTKEYKLSFAQKEIRFTVSGSADSSVIHVMSVD